MMRQSILGLILVLVGITVGCGGGKHVVQSDCAPDFTVEGSFMAGKTFKSFKDYSNISKAKAFDSAIVSLTTNGWQILNSNKDIGLISASQGTAFGKGATVPLNVLIQDRIGKGILVELTFKNNGGDLSSSSRIAEEFCKIYNSISPITEPAQTEGTRISPSEAKPNLTPAPQPIIQSTDIKNESTVVPQKTSYSPTSMIVIGNKAKIRKKPSTKAAVVKALKKGEEVQVIKQSDEWFQIELASGDVGWCHKSVLEVRN
jgi:hypothetical protein